MPNRPIPPRLTLLVVLFGGTAVASPLSEHFLRIELQRTGDRPTTAALVMDDETGNAWVDDVTSSSRLHGSWYAWPADDIEMILSPRQPQLTYEIEQRLVTTLNVHGATETVTLDIDATTAWYPLVPLGEHRYRMNHLARPDTDITPAQLIEIARRQAPDQVNTVKTCSNVDESPCELTTDHELTIYVRRGEQREYVALITLYER
jgi:hypothetical protein